MARKRYTVEQIIANLREAEVELAKGAKTPEVCRKLGISENTYYRWRNGGLPEGDCSWRRQRQNDCPREK